MKSDRRISHRFLPVLLVEDDRTLRDLLERVLTQLRFQVFPVATCSEAHRQLQQKEFDLVISDFHLPDGTGLGLYTSLRKAKSAVPFILASGDSHVTVSDPRFQFLSKPFTTAQLENVIQAVGERHSPIGTLRHIEAAGGIRHE